MNEKVVKRINKKLDDTVFITEEKLMKPYVCCLCDVNLQKKVVKYIAKNDLVQNIEQLKPKRDLHADVRSYYSYSGIGKEGLEDALLSPSTIFIEKGRNKNKFVCCEKCCTSVTRYNATPEYGIANYFEIGKQPKILAELTDVEIAFISDIRCHTHVITYMGGHKGIKGWHSLVKTNLDSKKRAMMGMDRLGNIPNKVVIIMTGEMTPGQRRIISRRAEVNRRRCKEAIEWLQNNHDYYKRTASLINVDDLLDPIVLNYEKEIESENTNLESREELTIAFPDGTLSDITGGYETVEQAKEAVLKLVTGNVEARLHIPRSEYVRDFSEDNFMVAFLREFPYGYGGPETIRERKDGSRKKLYLEDYIKHVTNLSNPIFSRPLFLLVCYNLYFRQKMVSNAFLNIKSTTDFSNLTPQEIKAQVMEFNHGSHRNNGNAENGLSFVSLVNYMTKLLPHTTDAAKRARQQLLSYQIKFGRPHIFFTVSPPDNDSVLITIYAGHQILELPDEITEDFLRANSNFRSKLRFEYPGLSTFNFQTILDIVIKDILGWGSSEGGAYGIPLAYFLAVEEQARKVLHTHILAWFAEEPINVKGLEEAITRRQQGKTIKLKKDAVNYVDLVQSCHINGNSIAEINHNCTGSKEARGRPRTFYCQSDEVLRFLRHKDGCRELKGAVAYCKKCDTTLTSSEISLMKALCVKKPPYKNGSDLYRLSKYIIGERESNNIERSQEKWHRLYKLVANEMIFRSKLPGNTQSTGNVCNALYNTHSSLHVPGCFKDERCECRFNIPRKSNKRTRIEISDEVYDCYSFRGAKRQKRMVEIVEERDMFDVCSNTFSSVVSDSKLACNSNISVITNGFHAFYVCKYSTKDTQKDDTSQYKQMLQFVSKRMVNTKFDTAKSESMSRVIGACLAHNADNVISATMAKYLIDNESRFSMSHRVMAIPIRQVRLLLRNEKVSLCLKSETAEGSETAKLFVDNPGLNYLLRPLELEAISVMDFFSKYSVCRKSKVSSEDGECFSFLPNHPGYRYLVVSKRTRDAVPGINLWQFVDCRKLSGDLLSDDIMVGEQEEAYAEAMLLLCYPFRENIDLKKDDSYVQKYREVYEDYIEVHSEMLQNMQDIRDSLNCRKRTDDLDECTECYVGESYDGVNNKDEENEEEQVLDESDINFINSLVYDESFSPEEYDTNENPNSENSGESTIDNLCLNHIRDQGLRKCGYQKLKPDTMAVDDESHFIEYSLNNEEGRSNLNDTTNEETDIRKATISDYVRLTLRRTTRKACNEDQHALYIRNPRRPHEKERVIANGTAESLIKWSKSIRKMKDSEKEVRFDKNQKKAFIKIMSYFLLTYMDEAQDNIQLSDDSVASSRGRFRQEKRKLKRMAGKPDSLLMFLDGPGGAGKSEVIKEIMKYAKEFCEGLGVPFTTDTILLTASTGVAATLIRGETVHRACHLESRRMTAEMRKRFESVRLIIVDEISMINQDTLKLLDKRLRDLANMSQYYGGKNVVFAGDFRQLEPIPGQNAIYRDLEMPEWMHAINTYLELRGKYRFLDDPEWGDILERIHDGNPLPSDFEKINERVVQLDMKTADGDEVPAGIRYATHTNKDRDAIGAGLFYERAKTNPESCLVVLADNLKAQIDKKGPFLPLKNKKTFYEECSEDDCKFPARSSRRMDPLLKLYPLCPMMLTDNDDVKNGKANGTEGKLKKVILKPNANVFWVTLSENPEIKVKAVYAGDISEVILQHDTLKGILPDFSMKPTKFTFNANMKNPSSLSSSKSRSNKIYVKMQALQLPFITNIATTCHKLQGSTRESLFISKFFYGGNWPYVALSRVKTLKGLFLREPLNPAKDYSMHSQLIQMKQEFKRYKGIDESYLEDIELL